VVSIANGEDFSCAVTADGSVRCWGRNNFGQLGDGTFTNSLRPVLVFGLTQAVEVKCGHQHACARLADGTVWCWGNNTHGNLGDGTTSASNTPRQVVGVTGATSLASGFLHVCAAVPEGVRCWGNNGAGELGDGTTTRRLTAVAVSGLSAGVVQVAANGHHTCSLQSNGRVRCWGYNFYGQLGQGHTGETLMLVTPTGLTSGVVHLSAGFAFTCAVMNSGQVRCWGSNGVGELGDGTTTNRSRPTEVPGLSEVLETVGGYRHTCARLNSGAMRCWGEGSNGQLGNGSLTNRVAPTPVSGLEMGVVGISAGYFHTCARRSDGTAMCWGNNDYGQVGDGATSNRAVPTVVRNLGSGGC